MSTRRQIAKKASCKSTSIPVTNPLKTRGFGKGIQAREAKLPETNLLQTRPLASSNTGLSQQQDTRSIDEQMEGIAQLKSNALEIPVHRPETPSSPPSMQRKEGSFGGWYQPRIQRSVPGLNRLNLWRNQELAQTQIGEQREASFQEGQKDQPEAEKQPLSETAKEAEAIQCQEAQFEGKDQVEVSSQEETIQRFCDECEAELDHEEIVQTKKVSEPDQFLQAEQVSSQSRQPKEAANQKKAGAREQIEASGEEQPVDVTSAKTKPTVEETGTKSEEAATQESSPVTQEMAASDPGTELELPADASADIQQVSPEGSPSAEGASAEGTTEELTPAIPELQGLQAINNEATETGNLTVGENTEAASQKTVAEKEEAVAQTDTAQAKFNATHAEIAQIAATGIHFSLPSQEETAGGENGLTIARQADSPRGNTALMEQQKAEASSMASAFLADAGDRVRMMTSAAQGIPTRIQSAAETAKASVNTAIAQQRAGVIAQITQQQAQAHSQAQATIAQIQAQYDTAVATIPQITATARQTLEAEYTKATQTVDQRESDQLTRLETLYSQAFQRYQAAGVKVGDEAEGKANQKADIYQSKVRNPKVDDSLTDGPLTDNRNEARAKAAREVGKQYKAALIEEADKQAEASQNGKPKDIEAVGQLATQSHTTLENQRQQFLDSLASAQAKAISKAQEAKASLIASTNQALQATLQSLKQQKTAQQQLISGYGQRQIAAIDKDAQKAIASLQDGVSQATTNLKEAIQAFQTQAQGMVAPDPHSLAAVLTEMLGQFDNAVNTTQTQTAQGIAASEQGILQGGEQASGAVVALGQGGIQEAIGAGQSLNVTLANLAQGATTTFSQIQDSHKTTVNSSVDTAVRGFQQVTDGIQTAFDQTSQNIESGIEQSVTQLETGLRGALSDLDAKIHEEAEKAADQVQPRWKSVVKILLVVAVIVVVALVAGPAVIGAVGAAAGALGASAATASAIGAIVGGAIVGAASGAVIQMGNNIIDGKDLMDGVGQAALVGAIGGALGGAGGVLGNSLANAGRLGAGMTQSVLKFGIDAAFDITGGLLGDLSVGNPITLEGVLIGAGIGAAVSISTANLGSLGTLGSKIEGVQTNFQNKGARFGDAVGTRFSDAVGLPGAGNRPQLDIGTPSTHSEVEVNTPKAGQQEAAPTTESSLVPREAGQTKPGGLDTEATATRPTQEPPAPKNSDDTADISGTKSEPQATQESSVEESGHIESNQLSERQIKNELDQINEHPDLLRGTPPNRKAKIGEHEWHEQPGGRWCRHSNGKVCVEKISPSHPEQEGVGNLETTHFGFKPRQIDIDDPQLIADADKLVQKVYEHFDSTIAQLSNKKHGPVLAGVMHRTTGIIDFDINQVNPYKQTIPELHSIVQKRLDTYIEKAAELGLTDQALGKELPGIHAEIKAASKVLIALEAEIGRPVTEADLEDLLVFNIRLQGREKGKSIIRCPNCQVLTKDALSISDLPEAFLDKLAKYRKTISKP